MCIPPLFIYPPLVLYPPSLSVSPPLFFYLPSVSFFIPRCPLHLQVATLQRHDRNRRLYLTKTLASLLDYRYWLKCKVYRTADLDAFRAEYQTTQTLSEKGRFVSDQMRVRQACYGIPKHSKKHPDVPLLSFGRAQAGVDAYLLTVCLYISKEAPLKLTLRTAGSNMHIGERPMDEVAQEIEVAYSLEMDRLCDQWFAEHPDGAFKAHRKKKPDELRPRCRTATRPTKGIKRKKPTLEVGNVAEVNGTTFVVFNMFAHPSSGNLVVAYYEAEMIEHDDTTSFETLRDTMDTSHEQDLYATAPECVSVADYEEAMEWMKNSDDVDPRHHIPGLSPTL